MLVLWNYDPSKNKIGSDNLKKANKPQITIKQYNIFISVIICVLKYHIHVIRINDNSLI